MSKIPKWIFVNKMLNFSPICINFEPASAELSYTIPYMSKLYVSILRTAQYYSENEEP